MAGLSGQDGSTESNFFVPMVDMLAGVIFVLVILLVSVSLVAREDFAVTEETQREVKRIQAELARARAAELTYLQPRRSGREAIKLLLSRLRDDLSKEGVRASIDETLGALRFDRTDFFSGDIALSEIGRRSAEALAVGLARYLPCFGGEIRSYADCSGFPSVRLARVVMTVHGPRPAGTLAPDAKTATEAQSVELYAVLVRHRPELIALQNAASQPLFGYAGFGESVPVAQVPAGGPSNGRVEIVFEMDVPPLPAAQ